MDKAYYREMWEDAREELKLVDEENKDLRAENARLKAEVERFKFTLEEERQITRQDWAGLRCEHDRVKRALEQAEAEVERLRVSSFVTAVPSHEYEELNAEVERFRKEIQAKNNEIYGLKSQVAALIDKLEGRT